MKWIAADIEMYEKAAEYVDTAIIPLFPISFDDDMKGFAGMAEFASLLTTQLEKQFKGRIFLLPGFSYIRDNPNNLHALQGWENSLLDKQFKYIFHITCDSSWKQHEKDLAGSLIWIPSLPLEHMQEQQKISIVEDQVKQLLGLFTQKWHEVKE
ncbi:YpiF family protein [Bacillus sp. REN3]|uniref:YpiF family protein n=1 Tax=Bacillus sp. REN3 TaxID=2802440 RepID=UPI001AEDAEE9|nr:YpiF family protein [Bacillus sp. REN3]